MNIRYFFLLPIFILITSLLTGQSDTGFLVKPYLQFSTQTGMYILWDTHKNATSKVEYGEATKNAVQPNLDKSVLVKGERTLHEVYLDNLKPETSYFYRVVSVTADGKEWISPTSTFKTAVKDSSALMFALIGVRQPLFVYGAHLIERDIANHFVHPNGNARRPFPAHRRQGRDNCRAQRVIGLVGRDDNARSCFTDLRSKHWIQTNEINLKTLGRD